MSALAAGCKEVCGFDLAESRMQFAQENGIVTNRVEDLEDNSIDFINTEQVFEHLVNPFEVAESLSCKLRLGGFLKISVPAAGDLPRRLQVGNWNAPKYTRDSLNPIAPLEHVNCWNRSSTQAMGERLSLKLREVNLAWQLAFVAHLAIPWTTPVEAIKSFARPIHRTFSSSKLYIWLQRVG